jgi:hypothetical protein
MVAIVTRAGKGSPLTNAEVDANFTNLNNGKVETNFSAVVAALGYTPYNATNPSNFLDQAGVRASFSVTGDLTYNSTTGVFGVNVPVTSVAGRTGAVTLTTTDVSEGTNQYFTNARARSALSFSAGSGAYNSSTGVITIPTNTNQLTNGAAFITASASITGNAATATTLQTARLIGGVSFNGSADINLPGVNAAGNQNTTGSAATLTTARTINGVSFNGSANITVTANTPNSVTFNNGGSGAASGSTFNGSGAVTVSFNTVGAPSTTGTNASGTWGISISGNAATVTNGVYTTGDQTIGGVKTFSSDIRVGGTSGRFINCDSGATNAIRFTNAANSLYVFTFADNGNFTAAGTVTANSDERLKKDWTTVPTDFLDQLAQVKHGTYTRIDTGVRQLGVSAQSLQPVAPEAVLSGEHLSVAYGNVALVAAIELAKELITIRQKLAKIIDEE